MMQVSDLLLCFLDKQTRGLAVPEVRDALSLPPRACTKDVHHHCLVGISDFLKIHSALDYVCEHLWGCDLRACHWVRLRC